MNLTLLTHGLVAGCAALAVWFYQDARLGLVITETKLEHSDAQIKAIGEIRARERKNTTKYQEALNEASKKEQLYRAEIDRLHATSDGLRQQNTDAAQLLATAPPASVLEYATALGAVFDDCRAQYEVMGKKAHGHAIDAEKLKNAWPE